MNSVKALDAAIDAVRRRRVEAAKDQQRYGPSRNTAVNINRENRIADFDATLETLAALRAVIADWPEVDDWRGEAKPFPGKTVDAGWREEAVLWSVLNRDSCEWKARHRWCPCPVCRARSVTCL